MGWSGHALGNDWYLYTRGGTHGVFLQKRVEQEPASEEIEIPAALLRRLVAEDIRSARMSRIEQMSADELLGLTDTE